MKLDISLKSKIYLMQCLPINKLRKDMYKLYELLMKVMKCGCELQKVSKKRYLYAPRIHVNRCDSKFCLSTRTSSNTPQHVEAEKAEHSHEAELIRK